jgi:YVTN family beta-propeller protein
MPRWSIAVLTTVVTLVTGCQMAARTVKQPRLDSEAELRVYLDELPRQAERLQFSLESVTASRADGQEVPLQLLLPEVSGKDERRQRLLASGRIPPGEYAGLAFRVKKATLVGDDGAPASLLVPSEPIRTTAPFQVSRARARVLSLSFQYGPSIDKGFNFRPSFVAIVPPLPIVDLLAFATDTGSDTVTVFDKRTRQVAAVLPTGRDPLGLAVDKLQGRLFVALQGSD